MVGRVKKIRGVLFVICVFFFVVVAYAADFDVTLPDTDGTSAFEVLDSGSTSLFRVGSDGAVTIDGIVNAKGFGDKLMRTSDDTFVTATADVEFYSPNQHGGIYGVIYRQYWDGAALPATLTSGNLTSKLIDYMIYFEDGNSNRSIARGIGSYETGGAGGTDFVEIYLNSNAANNNLVLNSGVNWTPSDGWVDYVK